jgi:hypothetical protein
MAHSSKLLYDEAEQMVADRAQQTLRALQDAEEVYQDLLEVFQYSGGTDQLFADQLFQDVQAPPAPADQVAMVADLRAAIVALHELYQAMTNVAVTTADREADLRRMS